MRQDVDTWKFYDVTHRDHVVCNPSSPARLDELIALLDLPPDPRVLDIASGKGWFLCRLAERCGGPQGAGVGGVAIDVSPFVVAELRDAVRERVPRAELTILEQDAATYRPAPASFDLAACVGASWIYGGLRRTLAALAAAVRPGGQVLVGEPFWRHEPDAEYLAWADMSRDLCGTHPENVAAGEEAGLVPLLAWVSTPEEWDRYETLQWRAAARYAAAHPDDPDLAELLARVARARHEYLVWGRDTLGWALYLFAVPTRTAS
jgi:SAM-dependent methyltransferase